MSKKLAFLCVLLIGCGLLTLQSQDYKPVKGSVCWPLHFAGITLAETTDSEAQRLLGNGVFRKKDGDTGGRYFVDLKHTATLHVVSYTDFVVGEVTLRAGIDPALKSSEVSLAETKWLKPDEGFGNRHELQLGSTKEEVLKNLGEPKERVNANDWQYATSCACELPEYFDLFFKQGHLAKIVFSAPAG
jgi:hypothetical protein